MTVIPDLTAPVTQAEFGRLVGRSAGRVSQLVSDGTLAAGCSGLEWLHAFIARLSDEAAGRHTDGPLDLGQERAALARSQREAVDMKNAVARGTHAPIEMLTRTLAAASSAFAERLAHLPAMLRRTHPDLPAAVLDSISATVADARNAFADGVVELVSEQLLRGDFDAESDDEPNEVTTP